MPRPLHSTERAKLEYLRTVVAARKADRLDMRDITNSVQNGEALPGNRTNPAERGKSRKPTDRLEAHKADRAYPVSDVEVWHDGKLVAVKRTSAKHVVRNADGTTHTQDTLAVLHRMRTVNASKPKGRQ